MQIDRRVHAEQIRFCMTTPWNVDASDATHATVRGLGSTDWSYSGGGNGACLQQQRRRESDCGRAGAGLHIGAGLQAKAREPALRHRAGPWADWHRFQFLA